MSCSSCSKRVPTDQFEFQAGVRAVIHCDDAGTALQSKVAVRKRMGWQRQRVVAYERAARNGLAVVLDNAAGSSGGLHVALDRKLLDVHLLRRDWQAEPV